MPKTARLYITVVALAGLSTLALALSHWNCPNPAHYLTYLMIALLASTRKVRLPGVRGTVSLTFLFILVGVADFTLPQTTLLAAVAAALQCLWKPKRRPKLEQVLFNIAALAISAALAHAGSHQLIAGTGKELLPLLLAVAVSIYYLTNTALVALVVTLAEEKPLGRVWNSCHLWSFPYYLVGATLAVLMTFSARSMGWKTPLAVLPLAFLAYQYYRLCLDRADARIEEPAMVPVEM